MLAKERLMKQFLYAMILVVLAAPAGFAREQSVLARVTVYWASGGRGSDSWTRRHVCSTGARLRAGHCAVDPRRIPYGSKVRLPDATLVAVDTGSAVVSRKAARRAGRTAQERSALVIDRFFETKQQALSWAQRNPYFMLVRVSPPGFQTTPSAAPPGVRAQTATGRLQSAPGPRRTLDARPRLSSRYAR
jgi:3D (Asp-Asp-Asp) domain-containing protein